MTATFGFFFVSLVTLAMLLTPETDTAPTLSNVTPTLLPAGGDSHALGVEGATFPQPCWFTLDGFPQPDVSSFVRSTGFPLSTGISPVASAQYPGEVLV